MVFGFLRRNIVTLALIVLVIATSHTEVVQAVDSVIDGNIVFTGPSAGGAKDIRTTTNDGGLRFYNGTALENPPQGAAIQFFGNDRGTFNGQAFIDSGAHTNAAIIFRTAQTGQAVGERMRISASGNVGIGTGTPQSRLQIVGNYLQISTTTSDPVDTDCDEISEGGRIVLDQGDTPALWLCVVFDFDAPPIVDWTPFFIST